TPFTVTDAKGTTTSENKASDWAWSLNLNINESKPSGALTYFRSGGVGGTVDYKVNVAEAGNYGITWQYRPNDTSYAVIQVLVNGKEVGGLISQKTGLTVGGVENVQNILRTVVLGNADFVEGENIITFKMVGLRDDEDLSKSGFTIDYIELTEAVDESGLTFTEFPEPEPEPEPEPVDPPKTGDAVLVLTGVAAVAAVGYFLLSSKRRRTQV
ncbi:MAG: hypothetical protein IJX76_06730, partial [Clostridia bacterium]|nr:hypothetical protein [Clostridia bacterium]